MLMVDIYRDTKRRGIYLAISTDSERDSCLVNNGIKMHFIFKETIQFKPLASHFDFRLTWILRNMGANQSSPK